MRNLVISILLAILLTISGCLSSRPDINNACKMLSTKSSWYDSLDKASNYWSVPKAMILAFIHQESKFKSKARPPRYRLFGIIPLGRKSSAYGYSQALDSTWRDYKKSTKNRFANRNDFSDSVDFVGWYINGSKRFLNLPVDRVNAHYLAYHEGRTGYSKGSYLNKNWLINVANKVNNRSMHYQQQLDSCDHDFNGNRFLFF